MRIPLGAYTYDPGMLALIAQAEQQLLNASDPVQQALQAAGQNGNVPAVAGATPVNAYVADPGVGGCPVIDASRAICALSQGPGQPPTTVMCSFIKECDGIIGGGNHTPLTLPGGGALTPTFPSGSSGGSGGAAIPPVNPATSGGNQSVQPNVQQIASATNQPPVNMLPPSSSTSSGLSTTEMLMIAAAAGLVLFLVMKK